MKRGEDLEVLETNKDKPKIMFKKIFNKLFKKTEVMSFKQGFDLTEMPIITLYQKEKKFNFLLDTGSNRNIIDKNILSQIEYDTLEDKASLMESDGRHKELSLCTITLSYKDKEYKYDYIIKDLNLAFNTIKQNTGVNLHGIIGSMFFNEYKYVLDFDELIAYSKM